MGESLIFFFIHFELIRKSPKMIKAIPGITGRNRPEIPTTMMSTPRVTFRIYINFKV